jgi:hypothetical protein
VPTLRKPLQTKEQDEILEELRDNPDLRVVVSLCFGMERRLRREIKILQKDNAHLLETCDELTKSVKKLTHKTNVRKNLELTFNKPEISIFLLLLQYLVGDKTQAIRVMGGEMQTLARVKWNTFEDMQLVLDDKERVKALVQYVADKGFMEMKPMESMMSNICTSDFRNRLYSFRYAKN